MGETYIIGQNVQRAIVTVCLLLETIPEIMFRNEVTCTRVQTAGEERGQEQVQNRLVAARLDDKCIES